VHPAFGVHLYGLLRQRGITLRAFAKSVGAVQPNITRIKQGRRPCPTEHAERWADELGLVGDERDRFLDLAALTHAPVRIQKLVAEAEGAQGATLRELATKQAGKDAPKG